MIYKFKISNLILCIVSVIILFFSLCVSVNAQESISVYNRNEKVSLPHGIFMYNEKSFIHIDDLSQLGLEVIEDDKQYIITSNDALGTEQKLVIKIGDSIGFVTPGDSDVIIKPIEGITPILGITPIGNIWLDETGSIKLLSLEETTVDKVSWSVSYTCRSTETIGYTGNNSTSNDTLLDDFINNSPYYEETDDMIKVNDEYYISAQYIGDKLSHGYSEENGRIDFYFAKPDSVLMETTVNFASKTATARSVNIYTAYKTGEDETIDNFEMLSNTTCTIPENETSIKCLIETPAEKISDKNIYLVVDYGERYFLAYDEFDFSKVGTVNVYGEQKDITYTVTVNLPEIDECDVPFTVYVPIGNNTYSNQGMVKSGEKLGTVEITGVPKRSSYETYIKFDYNKYKNISDRIIFLNTVSGDFSKDFTAEYSRMMLCTVSLPDDYIIDNDVEVELKLSNYIKSGAAYIKTPLTHWSDTKTIILNNENPSKQVYLYSQEGTSTLSYSLTSDVDGLNGKGFLRTDGKTTSDYNQSKAITDDSTADIQLLRKKTVNVTVIRPTALSVENDIFASVELDDKSTILYGDKIIDFTVTPLIPSGKWYSSFELNVAEDKNYTLKIDNITGDDQLFDYCCYVDYFATSAEENQKKLITYTDDSIKLYLLRCINVAGAVESEKTDLNFTAIAYCDLYNDRTLELKSSVEDGKFNFKIPDDANSYSLAVQTKAGKNSYYISDGVSTNDENEATKIRFEYDDNREVVLKYLVQNPTLPIEVSFDKRNNYFKFKNVSDSLIETDVFIAYYDRHGRLLSVEKRKSNSLLSGSNYTYSINTSDYKIYNVKAFALKKDEIIPLGNIISQRVNAPSVPKQNLSVFKAGNINAVVNCKEIVLDNAPKVINETLYISINDLEKLGYEVFADTPYAYIKNDKKFFEFMIDEYTVYDYNNRIISEINAPILNNDGVMIPLSVICELFDVKSEWHFAEEILFINKKFDDVEYTDVYCEAILGMYYKGVINGDENGVFHSQDFVKRSEASAMFSRTMGHEYDSYFFYCSDVDRDHWAQSFIGICINEGLFELENGKFRPNDNITVKETVIAALKMNGIYSENYIEKAKENGLLYLIDEENIERDITRAEMSQLLYNASK